MENDPLAKLHSNNLTLLNRGLKFSNLKIHSETQFFKNLLHFSEHLNAGEPSTSSAAPDIISRATENDIFTQPSYRKRQLSLL